MNGALLGLAIVVLFGRVARLDDENTALWAGLAAVAWFLPLLTLGTAWAIGCVLLVAGAYCARVMTRKPTGRGPTR